MKSADEAQATYDDAARAPAECCPGGGSGRVVGAARWRAPGIRPEARFDLSGAPRPAVRAGAPSTA